MYVSGQKQTNRNTVQDESETVIHQAHDVEPQESQGNHMKHISQEGPENASIQQIWPVKNKNKCHDHFVSAFRLFSIFGDDMFENNGSEV